MIPFAPSPGTVGIELELQLVDSESLDLVDRILPLMERLGETPFVHCEIMQNTVEICTPVEWSAAGCRDRLTEVVREVWSSCQELGVSLCGMGTHPFGKRLATITPLPRYLEIEKEAGLISHTQIAFATQVHLGVSSGDEALELIRRLKPLLPVLIAVSANSPFWRGFVTGHASYRQRILAATRSYGVPPSFGTWKDFCHFHDIGVQARMFRSISDLHWDLRPRPRFGTVEIRVMDAQPTIEASASLAALLRGLQRYFELTRGADLLDGLPRSLPWWTERDNHFEASRLGLDAPFVFSREGDVRPLRAVVEAAIEAGKLGLADDDTADEIPDWIEPPFRRQLEVYSETGSTWEVTADLRDRLTRELIDRAPAAREPLRPPPS